MRGVLGFGVILSIVVLYTCPPVTASVGEYLHPYLHCMENCQYQSCVLAKRTQTQNPINELLSWTCEDECKYKCMWVAVHVLPKNKVPQFFGKWPFIRILYMQEIASVVFSALNLVSQIYALYQFRKKVIKRSLAAELWQLYALVNINTWIWSMAFHCRDVDFTEKMDYISAFAVVVFFCIILAYRTIGKWPVSFNIFGGLCLLFYFNHASYIVLYHFDYGYNMKLNISVGSAAAIGWLIWCYAHRDLPYVHYMVKFILLTCATTALELLDFRPILWLFDAHAIWHLSTVPLHLILFRFAAEDCNQMTKTKGD